MSVIFVSQEIIRIDPYTGAFFGEIVNFQQDDEDVLVARVIAMELDWITLQPLQDIPFCDFNTLLIIPTGKPLDVNLSPTILGRKFNALGQPIDNLDSIPAINPVSYDSKPKKLAFNSVQKLGSVFCNQRGVVALDMNDLRLRISNLTQDNVTFVIVGGANKFRDKILNEFGLGEISVTYETGKNWLDWMLAMEQATVAVDYITRVIQLQVVLLIDDYKKYQKATQNQIELYNNIFSKLDYKPKYNAIIDYSNINSDSQVELWIN